MGNLSDDSHKLSVISFHHESIRFVGFFFCVKVDRVIEGKIALLIILDYIYIIFCLVFLFVFCLQELKDQQTFQDPVLLTLDKNLTMY